MPHKTILDGGIPVTMPIGLALDSSRNTSFISAIDKNHSCQESMITTASNVFSIIPVGDVGRVMDIEEKVGIITTGNAQWKSKGVYRCHPIGPEQYMFTATEPISVKFLVHKTTGCCSVAENAAVIGDNTYFSLNTIYTLIDYVRIPPLIGGAIEVRYCGGMMPGLSLDIRNATQN